MAEIEKLTITISPTATGAGTYVQAISGDGFAVNVVLIAAEVVVNDTRGRKLRAHRKTRKTRGKR